MADRFVPDSSFAGPLGQEYLDIISEKFGLLFDAVSLRQTAISNVGNDYTITIDPALNFDVLPGMAFYISPNVSNTGSVRLRVTSGNPYYAVVKADGTNLISDEFAAGSLFQVVFNSGQFRILSVVSGGGSIGLNFYYEFASSAILDLAAISSLVSPNKRVLVQAWGGGGGGGGGGNGGGGGGGAYMTEGFRFQDLPATVTCSVGSGGGVDVGGANSTFGALLTAYGGGAGRNATLVANASGGGGGGTSAPGVDGSGTGLGGFQGGGYGGLASSSGYQGANSTNLYGGGGGAGRIRGGSAVYGGGGGGGADGVTGGISLWGGNGGNAGAAGSVRGGGGGRSAAGGRGEIRVWI